MSSVQSGPVSSLSKHHQTERVLLECADGLQLSALSVEDDFEED